MNREADRIAFQCPHCGYRGTISRHKIPAGRSKFRVRCAKCLEKTLVEIPHEEEKPTTTNVRPQDVTPLQCMIDESPPHSRIDLKPGEFFGQVVIDKPLTILGHGRKTWIGARQGPVIRITSPGVILRNLMVETTGGVESVAIEAAPGNDPILDGLVIRGRLEGVAHDSHKISAEPKPPPTITFTPPPPIRARSKITLAT